MIETFILLQNISISDKCCSSELSIHQRNLEIFFTHIIKLIFFYYIFIIIIIIKAANQNIIMISEGSCDWNDDAKNSALKSQE